MGHVEHHTINQLWAAKASGAELEALEAKWVASRGSFSSAVTWEKP